MKLRHKTWKDQVMHFPSWPDGDLWNQTCSIFPVSLDRSLQKSNFGSQSPTGAGTGAGAGSGARAGTGAGTGFGAVMAWPPKQEPRPSDDPISWPPHSCPGVYELASLVYGSSERTYACVRPLLWGAPAKPLCEDMRPIWDLFPKASETANPKTSSEQTQQNCVSC